MWRDFALAGRGMAQGGALVSRGGALRGKTRLPTEIRPSVAGMGLSWLSRGLG